jgi:endonuclease I
MLRRAAAVVAICLAVTSFDTRPASATEAQYAPPAGYYASAEGLTGAALKAQLATIMTTGFVPRTYGDLRYAAAILDADPDRPGNILLIYNRASASATWDGGITYNREHQWPVSLLGLSSTSNSYVGVASDLFEVRPSNPSINSSRGNAPFGTPAATGNCGYRGSYYYPGNADSGDVARTMFYLATRWNSFNNLRVVNGSGGIYQMGDLAALLRWHYLDVPDTFERRRNEAVFSPALNPYYYQGNRNAYIDHPEFVWSVFVDQANDTHLSASTDNIDLGRAIVGAPLPTATVTIHKTGVAGTYYEVHTTGAATASIAGRFNAFPMDAPGAHEMTVGLGPVGAIAGPLAGTVVVDNLDITLGGGAGRGGNDPDDVVTVAAALFDRAQPSLADDDIVTTLALDFGTLSAGGAPQTRTLTLYNLVQTPGYTAALDLDAVTFDGDADVFTTTLAPLSDLAAGAAHTFTVSMHPDAPGAFGGTFALACSDENLPGAAAFARLTIVVSGTVTAGLCGDTNCDGVVDTADIDNFVYVVVHGTAAPGCPESLQAADVNGDGVVDTADIDAFVAAVIAGGCE